MIVIINHFDSFVFNLVHYFRMLACEVTVIPHDEASITTIMTLCPSHVVLSPGPCSPCEAPHSVEIVRRLQGVIPMLGVCLGHQIIGEVFGGEIRRATRPLHGQASTLHHTQTGLFREIPNPCQVGRYHSLIVSEQGLSQELHILARSEEQEIMAFASQNLQIAGVQFHPESILTQSGLLLLGNFLDGTLL